MRKHSVFGAILKAADKKYSTAFQGGVTDYAVPLQVEDGLARHFGYKLTHGREVGLRSMFPSPLQRGPDVLKPLFESVIKGRELTLTENVRAREVKDGMSQTFVLTEVAGRPQHWTNARRNATFEPLTSAWADPWISFRIEGINTPDGDKCVMQCDNDGEIYSFHPGGVNFLFADGHVAFLSAETEPRLVVALMTPDQNDNDTK